MIIIVLVLHFDRCQDPGFKFLAEDELKIWQ